ncbi:IclR helix-turn-helix domain-containing protein [Micromonospora yangpuensis]|uniref:IclR helix-turn-helix domain-containing protein n=1 Tax=Micromonospora yangpuensis TaxID=683228 RepID=A0A1C6VFP4_9ACTN|nr:IclR helix-turn-helix domain-containing protein [Micromonospora yangpuensis]
MDTTASPGGPGHPADPADPRPGADATRPGADATRPGTDATRPGTDATRPGTDATRPGTDATRVGADATRSRADAARAGTDAARSGTDAARGGETAQTLDRGLRLLHLVADAPAGLTVTEAANRLGIGRAAVYRLVGALTGHGMLRRGDDGRLRLGVGVLHLARRAQPLLAEGALPALRRLAEQAGATAHLTVVEAGEGVALAVVEPSWTSFHVAYRTGARHPLDRGAAGRAILAGRTGDPAPVSSAGELQSGAYGVAAPVLGVTGLEASVGVVSLAPLATEVIGAQVTAAAQAIATALA